MDQPAFDAQGLFDEDYLHFYAETLSDERSDADAELLWCCATLKMPMMAAFTMPTKNRTIRAVSWARCRLRRQGAVLEEVGRWNQRAGLLLSGTEYQRNDMATSLRRACGVSSGRRLPG